VVWGPRNAIIYELGILGSFVAKTMCTPPKSTEFLKAAENLISQSEKELGAIYSAIDDCGGLGEIRYIIWSDILECDNCGYQIPFWDAEVSLSPLSISSSYKCPSCGKTQDSEKNNRVYETYFDTLTGKDAIRRKRVMKWVYGTTNGRNWSRPATGDDQNNFQKLLSIKLPSCVPLVEIPWGDLYRSGYHKGITHAHHFYTQRNLLVLAKLWENIQKTPSELQDGLKLLVLSYNATHSTLMTRVVLKKEQKAFILTGAQSGILYISNLPVEKNIFQGLRRKAKTIAKSFEIIGMSKSSVRIVQGSSTKLDVSDKSVDYVFTDPPFGGFIPYAETNFLNEIWLGKITNTKDEVIISPTQKKTVSSYHCLMTKVMNEVVRTLKDDGKVTIVFHSSKKEVWQALQEAYINAGLNVEISTILDKHQGSFKQVNSPTVVKGDPLLLLKKAKKHEEQSVMNLEIDVVIADIMNQSEKSDDKKELTRERLYSRFISKFLEKGLSVPLDVDAFYQKIKAFNTNKVGPAHGIEY